MIADDNQVEGGDPGVVDVILDVMKTHANDAVICENGSRILWNITASSGTIVFKYINDIFIIAADNQMKTGECGAIEIVLNAIKLHINNTNVCESGCGALWSITTNGKKYTQVI